MAGSGRGKPRFYGGTGVRRGRALTYGGAEVAAVAHKAKSGNGFEGVEKAEHAALALADGEGKRFEQGAFESDPVRGCVHFVFGEFEFAIADIFVGEEFDFFEAHDLGA